MKKEKLYILLKIHIKFIISTQFIISPQKDFNCFKSIFYTEKKNKKIN